MWMRSHSRRSAATSWAGLISRFGPLWNQCFSVMLSVRLRYVQLPHYESTLMLGGSGD